MRGRSRESRRIIAALLAFAGAACTRATADPAATLPPVADFFRNADIVDAQLSPSGKYLAILGHDRSGRVRLATAEAAKPASIQIAGAFRNMDVFSFHWVSDDRLVYDLADWTGEVGVGHAGLIAADRDGSTYVPLIHTGFGVPPQVRLLPDTYSYFSSTHDGSEDIIVAEHLLREADGSERAAVLYRLNTRTREIKNLTIGQPPGVTEWLVDMDDSPRAAIAYVGSHRIVYLRGPDSRQWTVVGKFDRFAPTEFVPEFFGPDGLLYVRHGPPDALFRYDPAQRRFDEQPALQLNGFDLSADPVLDFKARKLLGYRYLTDAAGTAWIDPRFAEYQKVIDAALPGMANAISCGHCLESKYLLIRSASDRQPAHYYLFDIAEKRLVDVGSERPQIKPDQMGKREFVRYRARDGMSIPAYVTRPPDSPRAPLPLVVLVHGGPWVRGSAWEWDAEPQFLASRGYAVIQPEFRGSTGFGFDHFKAGWKQWGQAMQDDLADAAQWAVAQGIADPQRIAIAGASYGGYAALMGLVRNPEIFRCAVEWVGVTDINLLYTESWNDLSEVVLQYDYPALVGDPKADAEALKLNSPLRNARKIVQPVLMAYGSQDIRVPIEHGRKLRSAIATPRDDIEWVVYTGEGHGWFKEENRIDFWTRVEKFLDKYLRSPPVVTGSLQPRS